MDERSAEDGPAAYPVRRGLALLGLLIATVFLAHFNRMSIATAGDARVMAQYGFSPTRMGVVYSAYLLVYTVCMIPGGLFIDRFGARAALAALCCGSAVFVALTGVVGLGVPGPEAAFAGLVLVRGCLGFCSVPLHPGSARAIGGAIPPGWRSRANGLVNGSALVGIAFAPVGFGALIDRFDWPGAFLVSATLTACLAAVWLVVLRARPEAEATAEGAAAPSWFGLLRHRGLVLLTLSYGAVSYFQYLFFYWMGYYFLEVLRLPPTRARFYTAIPPLAMAVGMPTGGVVSDLLEQRSGSARSRRVVPMVGMTLGAMLLMLGAYAQEPGWIVFWFALALGAVGAAEGPFWATAVELGGRRGGSAGALFNTGGNAGGMLAPVVTAWVGESYGWGYAVGLGGLVCLAGVALWFGIDPAEGPLEGQARSS